MKKTVVPRSILKLSVLTFLLITGNVLSNAQTAYKDQLYISQESFTRQGSLLRVRMKVSYNKSALNTGGSITFTPIIKSDSNVCYLSSVIINGDRREKAEHRVDILNKRRRSNVPVVVRDTRSGDRYFNYDTTILFEDWMSSARLYTESDENDYDNHTGHLFEDLILTSLSLPNSQISNADKRLDNDELLRLVQFIYPPEFTSGNYIINKVIPLPEDYNKSRSKKLAKETCSSIISCISDQLSNKNVDLDTIIIRFNCAPLANRYKKDNKVAVELESCLRKYFRKKGIAGNNAINVSETTIDWNNVSSIVSSGNIAFKDTILNIIKTESTDKDREKKLMALDNGNIYKYLNTLIFPQTSRIHCILKVHRSSINIGDCLSMAKNDTSKVSLYNLYTWAMTYKTGSHEFNNIMELSAGLFPESPESNINAAGVSLLRGDLMYAHKYLERWMADPRAYNNIGVMYMLEGDEGKAITYFQMAKAAGLLPTNEAIEKLSKLKLK